MISQGHNLYKLNYTYHLQKLKLYIFNNDFKLRLQKVTYVGYFYNYLGQGQIAI